VTSAPAPARDTIAVQLRGITKRFPGVVANRDIDIAVRAGTVHAIVGENGAGKSTLMKILYGMQKPDEGSIEVDGRPVSFSSPADAISAGIGMVHQHFMLADNLTVLENVVLGAEPGGFELLPIERAAVPQVAIRCRDSPALRLPQPFARGSLDGGRPVALVSGPFVVLDLIRHELPPPLAVAR